MLNEIRLPTKITGLLRRGVYFIFSIAYSVAIFLCMDVVVKILPIIENVLLNLLAKFAVIIVVFIVGILLFIALILLYAIVEPFIVENILPKKIKTHLNIDKIEATYTPKTKS